ncbi:MAG: hypothetical protein U0X39_12190 [Bacteroidales bacterium]
MRPDKSAASILTLLITTTRECGTGTVVPWAGRLWVVTTISAPSLLSIG